MSNVLYSTHTAADIHPYRKIKNQRKKVPSSAAGKKEKSQNRIFFYIIIFLSILLAGELCFHIFIAPNLVIKKIHIFADLSISLTNDEILSLAGVEKNDYYFNLEPEEIRRKLEAFPLIKEASVERVFPDTLKITITGREALGLTLVSTGETTVPIVFDDEGIVFQIGSSVKDYKLPVISGIKVPSIQLGMKLPGELKGMLGDLMKLKRESPKIFGLISEMKFEKKRDGRYEAVLYPENFKTKVRLGEHIDENLLTYMFIVLDAFERQDSISANEIDFRTGEVILR